MENRLKVNVNMDELIECIGKRIDKLHEVLKILNGEDKKPSLKEQRIEVLKNFIANDLFDTTYNVEDVKVINFEVSSDDARYLRTDSSFEVDGKYHIRCLSYDSSFAAMNKLENVEHYERDKGCFVGLYKIKYLNNVVVIVRDLSINAEKGTKRKVVIDHIMDVLNENNDELLYIYWEEIGVVPNRHKMADIVNMLNIGGYNSFADTKGIFIERNNHIEKVIIDMFDLNKNTTVSGSKLEYYEGNHIHGNIYADISTEDTYYVLIYNCFEDYLDDALGLMEGNFIRTKKLDNDFYMIVLKNVPNIDMECNDEE